MIGVAGEGKRGTQVEGEERFESVVGMAEARGTLRYHGIDVMGNVVGQEF